MNHLLRNLCIAMSLGAICTASMLAFGADDKSIANLYVDFRLRYEAADQDNTLQDADAVTLRTLLGYKTAEYSGVSAVIEIEDSRDLLGIDDYSVPPTGFKTGLYSVIADPQTTEIDQAFVHYENAGFVGRLGRQVVTLDNHRFVGHVGFRQDRQTFDGLTLSYTHGKFIDAQVSHLAKRNRIFAEDRDIKSSDTLLNASFNTALGKFVAYAYLLEEDEGAQNSNDTLGLRFSGASENGGTTFLYTVEFATQETNNAIDTDYALLEGGVELKGITAKAGLESLGSDDGSGAFATPLATLHKFNGWADQFLSTPALGLDDLYFSVSGKAMGGRWSAIYHDFSSELSAIDGDDLGSEFDLIFSRKFSNHYTAGAKYADYSAGAPSFGKVDTRKVWLWAGAKF